MSKRSRPSDILFPMPGFERTMFEEGFAHASIYLKAGRTSWNSATGKHNVVGAIITTNVCSTHSERLIRTDDHAYLADSATAATTANRYAPAAQPLHPREEGFTILAAIMLAGINQFYVPHVFFPVSSHTSRDLHTRFIHLSPSKPVFRCRLLSQIFDTSDVQSPIWRPVAPGE